MNTFGPIIHIGYAKTGSTWMQNQVFGSEKLGFAVLGEGSVAANCGTFEDLITVHPLAFDANRFQLMLRPFVASSRAVGKIPVISHQILSGSPFSGGYNVRENAARLHAVFPDARIILGIREQKAIILSLYNQFVREGGWTTLKDFVDPPGRAITSARFDLDHFKFDLVIAHYHGLFGKANVFVYPYERLQSDRDALIKDLCEFTGAAANAEPSLDSIHNPSVPAVEVTIRRHLNPFIHRDAFNAYSPFAFGPLSRLCRHAIPPAARLLPRFISDHIRKRWLDQLDEAIGSRFAESNLRAGELIGLDLARFGYPVASTGDGVGTQQSHA